MIIFIRSLRMFFTFIILIVLLWIYIIDFILVIHLHVSLLGLYLRYAGFLVITQSFGNALIGLHIVDIDYLTSFIALEFSYN